MAVIGTMTKQPREKLPVDIDYTAVVAGRTVTSFTPTIETPVGITVTNTSMSGNKFQMYVSGGTTGTTYTITVLMDLLISGNVTTVEDEYRVLVEEVS